MDVLVLGSYIHANSLSVRRLPQAGESIQADRLWVEHGGKGLNLAVGMHRLGLQVGILLAIGDDAPGRALLQFLQTEGMDTNQIVLTDDNSGFGVGLVSPDGSNVIAIYPGANARLDAAHVQAGAAKLGQCRMVCAQFEIPDAPILEAFLLARQYGTPTLLAPSPWRTPHPALLPLTDILVLNETEAMAMFDIESNQKPTITDWLRCLPALAWQGKLLVITLAEQGCVTRQADGECHHVPAWAIEAADPTGAGDAFTAGLACALLAGHALTPALRFANACGAQVAARTGVVAALPRLKQVESFMQASLPAA